MPYLEEALEISRSMPSTADEGLVSPKHRPEYVSEASHEKREGYEDVNLDDLFFGADVKKNENADDIQHITEIADESKIESENKGESENENAGGHESEDENESENENENESEDENEGESENEDEDESENENENENESEDENEG